MLLRCLREASRVNILHPRLLLLVPLLLLLLRLLGLMLVPRLLLLLVGSCFCCQRLSTTQVQP